MYKNEGTLEQLPDQEMRNYNKVHNGTYQESSTQYGHFSVLTLISSQCRSKEWKLILSP